MTLQRTAVIFDVDGVLVDSYEAHLRSWCDIARAHGVPFNEQDFARTFGRTSRDIIRAYWPDGGSMSAAAIQAIDDEKEADYRRLVEHDFPAMDGARDLIELLHGWNILVGVGSSGPPANVELVLRRLDVCHWIGAFVTGMDVTRGKPDPQVFLLAAERLGIAPRRCVVVEDAPAGVEAARRAGMKCIGFASRGRTREELSPADMVVDSLREVSPATVRSLIG